MSVRHVWLAAAVAMSTVTGDGEAQEIGHPGRGLAAAQRLCAQCHAVESEQPLISRTWRVLWGEHIARPMDHNVSILRVRGLI
jgi:mono/diheme cytochrome c family protein